MYQPNFCAECGVRIVRERWHLWTSRRFCDACAPQFQKRQLLFPALAGCAMLGLGVAAGRVTQPAAPPLTVETRPAPSVPTLTPTPHRDAPATPPAAPPAMPEVVSLCGARTKKGTPCQRRVHGTGRCYQHTGQPAMLPQERLIVPK